MFVLKKLAGALLRLMNPLRKLHLHADLMTVIILGMHSEELREYLRINTGIIKKWYKMFLKMYNAFYIIKLSYFCLNYVKYIKLQADNK